MFCFYGRDLCHQSVFTTLGDHLRATLGLFERSATVGADALPFHCRIEHRKQLGKNETPKGLADVFFFLMLFVDGGCRCFLWKAAVQVHGVV